MPTDTPATAKSTESVPAIESAPKAKSKASVKRKASAKPKAAAKPKNATQAKAEPKAAEQASAMGYPFAFPFADLGRMPQMPQMPEVPAIEDLMAFAQGNLEAALKAGAILAEGTREVNTLVMDGVKASVEESAAATQALMDCHSLPDLLELNSGFARTAFETSLSESKKISEASLKTAEDAVEPLAERFALAVERFGLKDAA